MFDRNPAHRHKEVLPVRVVLDGKEPFDASVFVKVDERLSDLLNDPRPFLPVQRADGSVLMVAKSSIASIIERELTEEELAARVARAVANENANGQPADESDAKSEDDARRRAIELERLRAEIAAKRAAAKAAADQSQSFAGSDDPGAGSEQGGGAQDAAAQGPSSDRSEAPQRPNRPRRAFDPYAMLRVARGSSVEDIKKAYKIRIKAVHPDMIASLDLDEDVVKAMHLTAQRINQAYDRIMRELARAEDQATETPDAEKGAA